jgi:hypothetical protein
MELQVILVALGIFNAGAVGAVGYILVDLRSRVVRLEDSVMRHRQICEATVRA